MVKGLEQIQKQAMGFAPSYPMDDSSSADIQGPGQSALLVAARSPDLDLFPFGHPPLADFWQQMYIQFIRKDQDSCGLQVRKDE